MEAEISSNINCCREITIIRNPCPILSALLGRKTKKILKLIRVKKAIYREEIDQIDWKFIESTCLEDDWRQIAYKRRKNEETRQQTLFPATQCLGNYNLSVKLNDVVRRLYDTQYGTNGEVSRVIFKCESLYYAVIARDKVGTSFDPGSFLDQ